MFNVELERIVDCTFKGEVFAFIHEEPWEVESAVAIAAKAMNGVAVVDLRNGQKPTDARILRSIEQVVCKYAGSASRFERFREIERSIIAKQLKALVVLGTERLAPAQFDTIAYFCRFRPGAWLDFDRLSSEYRMNIIIVCSADRANRFDRLNDPGCKIRRIEQVQEAHH